jgi:hypothetical protein
MPGFIEKEKEIMDKIVEIHNFYIELEQQHPSDLSEWVESIHNLQKLMGMRILRREFPETFPTYNQK